MNVAVKHDRSKHAGKPKRRMLLIANANSRSGGGPLKAALDVFAAEGIEIIEVNPGSAAGISPAIIDAAKNADGVIVAGGDGTMNAAAHGLHQTGLPLGILPMGTANDLARTLGIPADLKLAADIIAKGRKRKIDVGEVNGHLFFNVASIGLAADLAANLTRESKRRFGRLSYALAAIRVLLSARPFTARIVSRTENVRVKTLQIAIGNGRFYGGGMAVESDAAIDDHHLDLYSLELKRVWKLALMARSFRQGRHGLWREVRTVRCKEFEIRTSKPRPINLDGELTTFTPAYFTVLPCAITVFAPPAPKTAD